MDSNDPAASQPIDEPAAIEPSAIEPTEPQEPVAEPPVEPSEPTEPQEPTEPVEPTEPSEPQEPEPIEAPKAPSRRENLRIQQILKKYGEPNQQPAAQAPTQQPRQAPSVPDKLDYGKALTADPQTIQTLEKDREAYGAAIYERAMREAQENVGAQVDSSMFRTRLEIDAPQVASKRPMLDQNSEEFHPALSNTVNQMYLSTVGFDETTNTVKNNNIRYSDYVEGIFELADEIASQKVESTQKNIASQAAKTGLRPDGSKAKGLNLNKAPGQMTDEELDAVISQSL